MAYCTPTTTVFDIFTRDLFLVARVAGDAVVDTVGQLTEGERRQTQNDRLDDGTRVRGNSWPEVCGCEEETWESTSNQFLINLRWETAKAT